MKNLFPLSFKWASSLVSMLIGVVIYIVVGAVAGLAIGFIGGMPIIGIIAWVLGLAVDVYVVVGIVVLVLAYLKVVK